MIIEDLVVDEAHRRRGVGQRLVELAERIACQRGCRGVELSCDLHRVQTHRFWEAAGYQREAYQFRKTL
jgi:GNAT superfamily N-acetyltransferase